MGRGGRYTMGSGGRYTMIGGRYSMGRGGRYTMGSGCRYTMGMCRYTKGKGSKTYVNMFVFLIFISLPCNLVMRNKDIYRHLVKC